MDGSPATMGSPVILVAPIPVAGNDGWPRSAREQDSWPRFALSAVAGSDGWPRSAQFRSLQWVAPYCSGNDGWPRSAPFRSLQWVAPYCCVLPTVGGPVLPRFARSAVGGPVLPVRYNGWPHTAAFCLPWVAPFCCRGWPRFARSAVGGPVLPWVALVSAARFGQACALEIDVGAIETAGQHTCAV